MVLLSKKRTLEILEKAKPGDKTSQYSDLFLSTLIILNLLAVSLESVESIGTVFRKEFYVFEDIVLSDTTSVESQDVIGAFKNDICDSKYSVDFIQSSYS